MSESTTAESPATTETNAETSTKLDAASELGENGVKALAAEREARKASEKATADLVKQLKAFEDRDKTEAQKQQEELESARAQLAELTTAKTRAEVAATKAVPANLLAGPASSSEADLAAYADALIAFKGEQASGPYVPAEGKSPQALALNGDGIEAALRQKLGI